jgi:hypothetical protein
MEDVPMDADETVTDAPVSASELTSALAPDATDAATRKRPKLDLTVSAGAEKVDGPRKKGRSMFGMLVGTLTKAKHEDKERSASEAVRHSLFGMLRELTYG